MRTKIDTRGTAAALAGHDGFALISNRKLVQLYTAMVQCRLLAERGGLGQSAGQEAAIVGVSIDLKAEDTIADSPGGRLADFVRGAAVESVFATPMAREAQPESALGAALLGKFRQNGQVVVLFGEPAASGWHEALRVAGAHQLPIVFVSWSGDLRERTRGKGAAAKAEQADFGEVPIIPVDGSDVVAVYRVATESIAHARRGNGPTLIDCVAYRLEGQRRAKREDPLGKMETYLADKGLFDCNLKSKISIEFRPSEC
jgi:TPP-dependent pyruvate/acetoin dehydrogenase alpha subunit